MTHNTHDLSFTNDMIPVDPGSRLGIEGDSVWRVNNSTIEEYAQDAQFPSYPFGLLGILESATHPEQQNVGMDLAGGSQAVALRNLLDSGVLTKGLVTNYEDLRTPATKADTRIDHIAGDLADTQTWQSIIEWQNTNAPDGLSLIMHQPYRGLQNFIPSVYARGAHLLLDMLKPGGVFYTQVPSALHQRTSDLSAVYRDLRTRPDVREIIPSTRSPYEEGRNIYGIIIKE